MPLRKSDRAGLVNNAAPIAGNDLEGAGQMAGAQNVAAPQSIFRQSSHPTALFFHLAFRSAALLTYLLCWLFTSNFVLPFVIIVLLLAFDFWTVKNVTGRLLVGLRWWNQIREDGSNEWVYESRENRLVNATDSRMFWMGLYVTPALWCVFAFISILKLSPGWFLVTFIGIVMSSANVVGYTRCEKDAKAKVTSYLAGNSAVQGFVGNMISNRLGGFFGGGATTAAPVR
ncbi:Golgi apparatus membrane protein TVP23 A [Thoreauomyces humboldtii]|nr:Golgi apparatus membrane protein TVP23 A [Thoreauomyces humboldtii]